MSAEKKSFCTLYVKFAILKVSLKDRRKNGLPDGLFNKMRSKERRNTKWSHAKTWFYKVERVPEMIFEYSSSP